MVNVVSAYLSLLQWVMKMVVGVRPCTVEIEAGTVIRFWVPTTDSTISISKAGGGSSKPPPPPPNKPVVVLLHGFCGDGIMNWQFQVGALTKKYAVYVPDLLFFGGSFTDKPDRSLTFHAECLAAGLRKLGVEKCVVVGFSYGGVLAFKMAELYHELMEAIVVSGACVAMTESVVTDVLEGAGYYSSSLSQMLLPTSVKELKTLLSVGAHKKIPFPNRLLRDFLQVMYSNRTERGELLDAMVISYQDINIPKFPQRTHLLWGENDQILQLELAQKMKGMLGSNTTFESINKAGHLVHMERPYVYNRCLNQFLSSLMPATKNY